MATALQIVTYHAASFFAFMMGQTPLRPPEASRFSEYSHSNNTPLSRGAVPRIASFCPTTPVRQSCQPKPLPPHRSLPISPKCTSYFARLEILPTVVGIHAHRACAGPAAIHPASKRQLAEESQQSSRLQLPIRC